VPAIIVATARNAGFPAPEQALGSAIRRGAKIPGGSCGYLGVCGAASGVGTGFSVLLESTPLTAGARQQVMSVVGEVTAQLASLRAARCCQRDCYLALRVAAERSPRLLGVSPTADSPLRCAQVAANRECLGKSCPLHPGADGQLDASPALRVTPQTKEVRDQ
jgi:hypothetical protein